MVLWWLLIEHSKSRVVVVFFCLLSRAARVKIQKNCKQACILDWCIIDSIYEHACHDVFMRGEGSKGDIGEETSNLGCGSTSGDFLDLERL